MAKPKVELIIAHGKKLDSTNSLVVFIDPQYADWCQQVYDSLHYEHGVQFVTVLPMPHTAVKFYQVEHPYSVEVSTDIKAILNDSKP